MNAVSDPDICPRCAGVVSTRSSGPGERQGRSLRATENLEVTPVLSLTERNPVPSSRCSGDDLPRWRVDKCRTFKHGSHICCDNLACHGPNRHKSPIQQLSGNLIVSGTKSFSLPSLRPGPRTAEMCSGSASTTTTSTTPNLLNGTNAEMLSELNSRCNMFLPFEF